MLDALKTLNGTVVPDLLIGFGAFMILLSLIQRRAVAMTGGLLFLFGVMIALAPSNRRPADQPRHAATAPGPGIPVASPRLERASPGSPDAAKGTEPGRVELGGGSATLLESDGGDCTAELPELGQIRDPERRVISEVRERGPIYNGFLSGLMPSATLFPCVAQQFESEPLTARTVAQNSLRPTAEALRILTAHGFSGLKRTYGVECLGEIGADEIPRVSVTILRFDTADAAQRWEAVALDDPADVSGLARTTGQRLAWLRRTCGDAKAAVLWREDRVGNVAVSIEVFASPENLASRTVVEFAGVLADDIAGKLAALSGIRH
jgi:hypothetical protein